MAKSRKRVSSGSRKPIRKAASVEPDFVMLLAEPEVRLLMCADRVDETELLNTLQTFSVQLREDALKGKRAGSHLQDAGLQKYRPGVGVVLINKRGDVFIARRNDVRGNAWQMPQGGIDQGETPDRAAFRELKEEIGTDNAKLVAQSKQWLYYDVPASIAKKAWSGRWKGQRQKWFLMLFTGSDSEIDVATNHPEFDSWRWTSVDELESLAVSFKKKLYASLLEEFAPLIRSIPKESR